MSAEPHLTSHVARRPGWFAESVGHLLARYPARVMRHGLPRAAFGWRWIDRIGPAPFLAARGGAEERWTPIHAPATEANRLPANVGERDELDTASGQWGFSFRSVPDRESPETYIARFPGIRIAGGRKGPERAFTLGFLTQDKRSLELPGISFLPCHGERLSGLAAPRRLKSATWVIQGGYDDPSRWLLAHLPKLMLLRERGMLEEIILPVERTPHMEASLARLGIDPRRFRSFDHSQTLEVDELAVVGADPFRPELLRPLREALVPADTEPRRRILLRSRHSGRGRLAGENALWPKLEARGFECVCLEEVSFDRQIRLLSETTLLLAPPGTGLAAGLFCPKGTDVMEIVDPGWPDPQLYALASAMGHRYWLLRAEPRATGDGSRGGVPMDPAALLATVDQALDERAAEALGRASKPTGSSRQRSEGRVR